MQGRCHLLVFFSYTMGQDGGRVLRRIKEAVHDSPIISNGIHIAYTTEISLGS